MIHDDEYLLTCMRYIELNPVRASMTNTPGQCLWSSYRVNARGKTDKLVTPHPLYVGLGRAHASRREAY